MTAAKILGYKEVPIIINSYDPNYKPEGRELKSDDEIRALFRLGKDLQIRRNKDGMIDQIMPPWYEKVKILREACKKYKTTLKNGTLLAT